MTPALEYLIRTDLIKDWFKPPCSLLLYNDSLYSSKFVITISEEFKPSKFYSVKHWLISDCTKDQVLPSMIEHLVPKEQIFSHPTVIVEGCRPFYYEQKSIGTYWNSKDSPMTPELYRYLLENALSNFNHQTRRVDWLWIKFVKIYASDLFKSTNCLFSTRTEAEIARGQRDVVFNSMKRQWQYWIKWQKHMLPESYDAVHSELIFYKEYHA